MAAAVPAQTEQVPTAGRLRALTGDRLALLGAAIVLVVLVCALLAPVLAPSPEDAGGATDPVNALLAPSGDHLLGTDQVGRDILSRLLYGARTSLRIAVEVIGLAILIGLPLGMVAGYVGGLLDDVLMRVTDVFLAFPALLLALALAAVLTPSVGNAAIAIAVTWWPWYARLIRAQAATVASSGYVASARALGVSHARILLRHVLPNSAAPVIVQASVDFGGVILTAAALSYLGLGAQDPTPEWGLMVSQGQSLFTTQWWVVTFPGLAILLTALGFNLLGDGLRSILDPRQVTRDRHP
ncbi:MAG: Dipeptide transport system permease protein DppC [uncultured Thermoleophilia bacterium]|uniref:Dipeptide transport system permease protein DppC n=1 Tax=uncultured Thermoleophilia bacterium TaxID=1497501 RepID=A0A6J4U9F8_9ACTN|nr:MAG: Dipeptide transport system permease protein DppC [uncultured Thermoleophilia bacterium]